MISKIIDFVLAHWELFVSCAIALINLVVLICKKKVKITDTVFTGLLLNLPAYIKEAEESGKKGDDKLSMVLNSSLTYLMSVTGDDVKTVTTTYGSKLMAAIEDILATPQKKEV